jgi:hypothetical protein
VPAVHRYYVVENTCVECSEDWIRKKPHIDLYVSGSGEKLAECEDRLTMQAAKIIVSPPPGLPRYGQLFWPGRVAWVMLQHYRGRPEELHFARAISLAADGFARQDKPNLALSEPPIVPLVAQRGLIACGGCFVVG